MNVGGPAWQVSALTRGLDPDRYVTRLICGEVDGTEADYVDLRDPSLPVHRVSSMGRNVRILDDFHSLLILWKEIRDFKPDIVHTHTAKAGFLGRLVAIVAGVPVTVHTFHGHLLHGYFSPLKSRLIQKLESFLARRTTVLIAVGEQVRDDLLEAGIGRPDQYSVVAPGVGIETLPERHKSRDQFDLPLNSPVLLFVGRLTQVKRPDRLIDAMRIVLERVPEAVLVVAGGGEQLEEARSRARPLGDSVRFLGWSTEINALCAAADLAVICSDNEGMPVTLIEAAFAGLPAVATDVGSVREVVLDGVTGLLVDPTAEAVAAGVIQLFENADLRARMASEASRRAIPRFGLERLIHQHDELYQSTMES